MDGDESAKRSEFYPHKKVLFKTLNINEFVAGLRVALTFTNAPSSTALKSPKTAKTVKKEKGEGESRPIHGEGAGATEECLCERTTGGRTRKAARKADEL